MLTVTATSPQNHQENVFRDTNIQITFSHEVHDTSLTADNFKLYLMPDWAGYVPLTISKQQNIITLVPNQDLDANHEFALWIKGDKNLADASYDGVVSITGDVLDGHQLIYFKTGADREVDVNVRNDIGGYQPVPGTTPVSTEEVQELLSTNKVLDVVRTYPKNKQTSVNDISTMRVVFDQNVSIIDVSGLITITQVPLIFGEETPELEVLDISTDGANLYIETDSNISGNIEYQVLIDRSLIVSHTSETLPEDYLFSFSSALVPMYTSIYLVRQRGGFLIPSDMQDWAIERYIHIASMWVVDDILKYPEYPTGTVPKLITQLVTCKSVQLIATAITQGALMGIKERQLADLRIVYDTNGLDKAMIDIQNCIDTALASMGRSKIQVGVKSSKATLRPYLGPKRHILKYDAAAVVSYDPTNDEWDSEE